MDEIKISEFKTEKEDLDLGQPDQETQLEMLTEECQELINRLSCSFAPVAVLEQTEPDEPINEDFKKQKARLQKQYLDLCIEIERQQKQLDNYKFKIKVSNKEAEYYSRQIKEKEQILENLQKHQVSGSAKKSSRNSKR